MRRLITHIAALLAMLPTSAYAATLLDEDFNSAPITEEKTEADFALTGWKSESGGSASGIKQWRFYGEKRGDVWEKMVTVAGPGASASSDAVAKENWRALYTPEVNLDGNYQFQFDFQISPLVNDKKYKFTVYAVENGKTWSDGTKLFDLLDKDDLLESCGLDMTGINYYNFTWDWTTAKINLSSLNGKKVRLAIVYEPLKSYLNGVWIDKVKIVESEISSDPKAQLSVPQYDFGNVYVGSRLYSDVLSLKNIGAPGLKVSSVELPAGMTLNTGDTEITGVDLKTNEAVSFQIVYEPQLTTPANGSIIFRTNGGDVSLAVKSVKQSIPDGGCFEGFEGEQFPPAGWTAEAWSRNKEGGIEGLRSAMPNAYYQQANYLMTPRIDASGSPATISFSYADFYGGEEEYGADTAVKLYFSKDGGSSWTLIDTYDYNDPYDTIIHKSYSQTANSSNCYWKWEWELTYYDSETGANASAFYLDAVVLSNLYGHDAKPEATAAISPADGTTELFNRDLELKWEPRQFAEGYRVYVGTNAAADNLVNAAVTAADVCSYVLPELSYATTYNWKIVPYNSKGDAEGVKTWKFTTISDPTVTAYPYSNGFEDFPGKGWNIRGNGKTEWSDNRIEPFDGEVSAYAFARDHGEYTVLETPPFEVPASGALVASFYWGDDAPRYLKKDPTGQIVNTTTKSDGISDVSFEILADGKWKQLRLLSDKENHYWVRERVELNEYAGKTVAFRWVYTVHDYYHAGGSALDNFTVTKGAGESLSFSAESFSFHKVNNGAVVTTPADFTLLNDGTETAEIESVTFSSSRLGSSLKAGDKVGPGSVVPFTLSFDAGGDAEEVEATMTVKTTKGATAIMNVSGIALAKDVIFYGFEYDENGSLEPRELTLIDEDSHSLVALTFVDYPHKGDRLAFMVIDYRMNDWPIPYSNTGYKCLVTFGLEEGTSKDWLVGPTMTATDKSSIEFYGRNYESADQNGGANRFGPGRVFVVVSEDTDNPENLNGYEEAESFTFPFDPADSQSYSTPYHRYEADLSAFAGKRVRVGLRLESDNGLAYFLDDIQMNHFESADFNSIASVGSESSSAPVYYNLQGQRLAAPASGTIVIVNRGGNITKEIIR